MPRVAGWRRCTGYSAMKHRCVALSPKPGVAKWSNSSARFVTACSAGVGGLAPCRAGVRPECGRHALRRACAPVRRPLEQPRPASGVSGRQSRAGRHGTARALGHGPRARHVSRNAGLPSRRARHAHRGPSCPSAGKQRRGGRHAQSAIAGLPKRARPCFRCRAPWSGKPISSSTRRILTSGVDSSRGFGGCIPPRPRDVRSRFIG